LSGILQQWEGNGTAQVSAEQLVGGALAATSLLMHSMNPYRPETKKAKGDNISNATVKPVTRKARKTKKED